MGFRTAWNKPPWFIESIKSTNLAKGLVVAALLALPFLFGHYFQGGHFIKWRIIRTAIESPGFLSITQAGTYILVYGPIEVLYIIFIAITAIEATHQSIAFYIAPLLLWVAPHGVTNTNGFIGIVSTLLDLTVILGLYRFSKNFWPSALFWTLVNFMGW